MHRAAGRIEHQNSARIFEWAVRDLDGLLEHVFLRKVVLLRLLWDSSAKAEEEFVRTPNKVTALVFELRFQVVICWLVQDLLLAVEFRSRVLQPMLETKCGECASLAV